MVVLIVCDRTDIRYGRKSAGMDFNSIDGEFVANGVRPSFMLEFEARNIESPANVFDPLRPLG